MQMQPDGSGGPPPGLEQCLELLRGPQDERRFVGLLLATKLLPAGNQDVLLAISSAVSFRFLSRLLLPLQSSKAGRVAREDELPKTAAAAGLGLAVLSSLFRVHELACSDDALDKVPLFVKVIRSGGINPILQPNAQLSSGSHEPEMASTADSDAVGDALDCLSQITAASPDARIISQESGCLPAVVKALNEGVSRNQPWQGLAVQLLINLLQGSERSELLADHPDVVPDAVPPLAQLLSMPAPKLDSTQQQHSPAEQTGASSNAISHDAAQLQLQAMQAMLLLLPLQIPEAEAAAEQLKANARRPQQGWGWQAQTGLYTILISKTGAQQRHAALRLTAAILELLPPSWLLGPANPTAAGPGAFFQVVAELLKVEASLLLNDAVAVLQGGAQGPHQQEPDSASTGRTNGQPGALYAAFHDQPRPEGPNFGGDTAASSGASRDASHPQDAVADTDTDTELPSISTDSQSGTKQAKYSSDAAARRVSEVLPAVLYLLEVSLEALAQDTQAAEDASDQQAVAVLDDRTAQRIMQALSEASEQLLQFLELAAADEAGDGQDNPWLVSIARAYGRFIAEVPQAHAQRLQAILPFLLKGHNGQALPFLLPGLLQCSEQNPDPELQPSPQAFQQWLTVLQQPEVVSAVSRHVAQTAQEAQHLSSAIQQSASPAKMAFLGTAEDALAAACMLLRNILAPRPLATSTQEAHEYKLVHAAKPAITSLVLWSKTQQWRDQEDACLKPPSPELVAVVGHVCASSLYSALQQSGSTGNHQSGRAEHAWSSQEEADTFNAVLWSLAAAQDAAVQQPSADDQTDGDADTEAIRDWQATLLQGQFLLESRVALKQQALQNSWVQACLRPDLQLQNPLLGSFVQAFMH